MSCYIARKNNTTAEAFTAIGEANQLMQGEVIDLGLIEYERAWKLQDEYAAEIAEGKRSPTLLLLEHPHVYTFGRKGNAENLLLQRQ